MDITELRQKPEAELRGLLAEFREKLRSLRFEKAANRLKNVREIPMIRRDIARIHTIFQKKVSPAK